MLSAWHDLGLRTMRERLADGASSSLGSSSSAPKTYQPQSWLSQQRARANGRGLVRLFLSFCPISPLASLTSSAFYPEERMRRVQCRVIP